MPRHPTPTKVIDMTPAIFRLLDHPLPSSTTDAALTTNLTSHAKCLYDALAAAVNEVNPAWVHRAIYLFCETWADHSIPFTEVLVPQKKLQPNKGEIIEGLVALWRSRRAFFGSDEQRDAAKAAADAAGLPPGTIDLDLSNVWTGEKGVFKDDPLAHDEVLSLGAPPLKDDVELDADAAEIDKLVQLAEEFEEEQERERLLDDKEPRAISACTKPNLNPFIPPSLSFPLPNDMPALFALLLDRYKAYAEWWGIESTSATTRAARDKRYEASLRDVVSRCGAGAHDLALLLLMPFVPHPIDLFDKSAFSRTDYLDLSQHVYIKGCTMTLARLTSLKTSSNNLTARWASTAVLNGVALTSVTDDVKQELVRLGASVESLSKTLQLVHGGQTCVGRRRHVAQVEEILGASGAPRYYVAAVLESLSWSDALARSEARSVSSSRARLLALAEHGLLVRGFGDASRGGTLLGDALDQNRDDLEVLAASLGGVYGTNVKEPGSDRRTSVPVASSMFSPAELVVIDAVRNQLRQEPPKYLVVLDSQPPVCGKPGTHWQAAKMSVIVNALNNIFGDSVELCFVEGVAAAIPLLGDERGATSNQSAPASKQLVIDPSTLSKSTPQVSTSARPSSSASPNQPSSSSPPRRRLVVIAENLRPDNKVYGVPYTFPSSACGPHLQNVVAQLPPGPVVILSLAGKASPLFEELTESTSLGFLRKFTGGFTSLVLGDHVDKPLVFAKTVNQLGNFRRATARNSVYGAVTASALYALALTQNVEKEVQAGKFDGAEALLKGCIEIQQIMSLGPLAPIVDHKYTMFARDMHYERVCIANKNPTVKIRAPLPTERNDIVAAAEKEGFKISYEDYETIELLALLSYPSTGDGLLKTLALSRTTATGPTILTSLGQSFMALVRSQAYNGVGTTTTGHHVSQAAVALAAVREGEFKIRLVASTHARNTAGTSSYHHTSVRRWSPSLTKDMFDALAPVIGSSSGTRYGRFTLIFDSGAHQFRLQHLETGHRSNPVDVAVAAAELVVPTSHLGQQALVGRYTGHQHLCLLRCIAAAAIELGRVDLTGQQEILTRAVNLALETGDMPFVTNARAVAWLAGVGRPAVPFIKRELQLSKVLTSKPSKATLAEMEELDKQGRDLDELLAQAEDVEAQRVDVEEAHRQLDERFRALGLSPTEEGDADMDGMQP